MEHCIAKIEEIIERGRDDRRSILQLGYNLGRLSELTGLGREPFWDRWKGPVASWDQPELERLARELRNQISHPDTHFTPTSPTSDSPPRVDGRG
jgi:hypothetical protein